MVRETLFTEIFDTGLDPDWSWLRPKEGGWRLTENGLEIRVEPGKADTVVNALLRPAPDRSIATYALEVTVSNRTPPTQQYEQLGITWYAGGAPVFKLVKELIDGDVYIIPGRCPVADEAIRLRLIVGPDGWEAQYKTAGEAEFRTADKGELPAPDGDRISLQCYNGPADAEHWVRFEDFSITRLA